MLRWALAETILANRDKFLRRAPTLQVRSAFIYARLLNNQQPTTNN